MIDGSKKDLGVGTSVQDEEPIVSIGKRLSDTCRTYGGGYLGIFILSLDGAGYD